MIYEPSATSIDFRTNYWKNKAMNAATTQVGTDANSTDSSAFCQMLAYSRFTAIVMKTSSSRLPGTALYEFLGRRQCNSRLLRHLQAAEASESCDCLAFNHFRNLINTKKFTVKSTFRKVRHNHFAGGVNLVISLLHFYWYAAKTYRDNSRIF